jgi:hypothetical protein
MKIAGVGAFFVNFSSIRPIYSVLQSRSKIPVRNRPGLVDLGLYFKTDCAIFLFKQNEFILFNQEVP